MSVHTALPASDRPARWRRPPVRTAIATAWVLGRLSPRRIRTVLYLVRRGARPATYGEAQLARTEVMSLSVACAGEGCLQRSLATALLCRMRGSWPTWCTGVRTQPFAAHAWVEAEGTPVGEDTALARYRPIMTVPPTADTTAE